MTTPRTPGLEAQPEAGAAAQHQDGPNTSPRCKTFPIHPGSHKEVGRTSVPWSIVEGHGRQALVNHSQTLERLAERGGLSTSELYAVAHDVSFWSVDKSAALAWLESVAILNPVP